MSRTGLFVYTADLIRDTRCLSIQAKGAWYDALFGFLHEAGGSVEWSVTIYARYWGVTDSEAVEILLELEKTEVADVLWWVDSKPIANAWQTLWQNDSKTLTKNSKTIIAKLINRRMVRETEKKLRIQKVRTDAGLKGASKRWQKKDGKNGSLPSPSPSPSLFNHKEKYKKESGDGVMAGAFEAFWAVYPRTDVGKKAARDKFLATLNRVKCPPEDLIRAAENYRTTVETERRETVYIKHGATFLGPTEPWRDYLNGPVIGQEKDKTPTAWSALKRFAEKGQPK